MPQGFKKPGCVMKRQEEKTIVNEPVSTRAMNCLEVITVRVAEKEELENALEFCTQVFHTVETRKMMNLTYTAVPVMILTSASISTVRLSLAGRKRVFWAPAACPKA